MNKTYQQKLEAKGYVITFLLDGGILATRDQETYKTKNITQLYKLLSK